MCSVDSAGIGCWLRAVFGKSAVFNAELLIDRLLQVEDEMPRVSQPSGRKLGRLEKSNIVKRIEQPLPGLELQRGPSITA